MNTLDGIPTKVVFDRRILPEAITPLEYNILKPCTDISLQNYVAQSFSDSLVSFNITAPSLQSFLDRKVLMKFQALFTITTSGRASNIFSSTSSLGGLAALRQVGPFQQACSNVVINCNNTALNYTPQYMQSALVRYGQFYDQANTDIGGLGFCDQSQKYSDVTGPRSPLSLYTDTFPTEARGDSYDSIVITNISVNQATVLISWTEQFLYAPFTPYGSLSDEIGLAGLNSLQFTFNIGSVANMLSVDYDAVGLGNAVSVVGSLTAPGVLQPPTIYMTWLNSAFAGEQFMRENKYGLSIYNNYLTSNFTIGANVQNYPVTTQVTQLNSVPSAVFLYCQQSKGTYNSGSTDTFLKIESINMTFGNKTGILSASNNATLYQMSSNSGLKLSHMQFAKHVGSIIKIDFAKQVPLSEDTYVGSPGLYTLQFNLLVSNLRNSSVAFDCIVLSQSEAILMLQNAQAFLNTALVMPADVIRSRIETGNVTANDNELGELAGGDLTKSVKAFSKRVAPVIKKYGPAAVKYGLPLAQAAIGLVPGGSAVNSIINAAKAAGPEVYAAYNKLVGNGMQPDIAYAKAVNKIHGGGAARGGKMIKNKAKLRAALAR